MIVNRALQHASKTLCTINSNQKKRPDIDPMKNNQVARASNFAARSTSACYDISSRVTEYYLICSKMNYDQAGNLILRVILLQAAGSTLFARIELLKAISETFCSSRPDHRSPTTHKIPPP
jgi:hypothetical protein